MGLPKVVLSQLDRWLGVLVLDAWDDWWHLMKSVIWHLITCPSTCRSPRPFPGGLHVTDCLQGAASAAEIGSIIVCPEHKFKLQFELKLFISVVSSLTCGHIHALFLFELECEVSSFRALLISSFIALPHFLLNFYVYESSNTENIGFDKKTTPERTKKQTRKPKSRKKQEEHKKKTTRQQDKQEKNKNE